MLEILTQVEHFIGEGAPDHADDEQWELGDAPEWLPLPEVRHGSRYWNKRYRLVSGDHEGHTLRLGAPLGDLSTAYAHRAGVDTPDAEDAVATHIRRLDQDTDTVIREIELMLGPTGNLFRTDDPDATVIRPNGGDLR